MFSFIYLTDIYSVPAMCQGYHLSFAKLKKSLSVEPTQREYELEASFEFF
jgi:hypothetical protein